MTRILLIMMLLLAPMSALQAAPVEFTYTGYVKVQGSYFSGPGQFKFAIVNRNGSSTFWSNDGTSRNAAQPTASLPLNVIDGYFAVAIGDTEAGMEPLDAAAFNSEQQYYLRVWFNDGTHGFERLTPDQRIVNPALLGATQQSSTIIYVNPVTGDDANVGNVPDSPKRTIQAAWNTLPTVINTTATIQLQDGIYRDTALLTGKNAVGGAAIVIQGNPTTRSLTMVTGASASNPTSGTTRIGWDLTKQTNVELRDVQFEYFTFAAVQARDLSQVVIRECTFSKIHRLGLQGYQSSIYIHDTEFGPGVAPVNATQNGMSGSFACYVELRNCDFHNLGTGAYITRNSNIVIRGSHFADFIWGGVYVFAGSSATFGYPTSTMARASFGVKAESNCDISYVVSYVSYSQITGQNYILDTGSYANQQ